MSGTAQLIFGTAGLSALPTQGRALRLLEEAYHGGIRHFDTAPLYGQGYAEWVLGRFLARKGQEVLITGKFGLAAGVSPTLDPRLAMPLNYIRKRFRGTQRGRTQALSGGDPATPAWRRITREQVESSFNGSLKRLGCARLECFLIHEGLPSFLDDEARTWLLRRQSAGAIGSLGVAAPANALLGLSAGDLEGFEVLQYEAGSIFEELMLRYPEKRHFLHSCFSKRNADGMTIPPSEVLSYWSRRNPEGKLLFFTRRPAVLRENIAGIQTNQASEGHALH